MLPFWSRWNVTGYVNCISLLFLEDPPGVQSQLFAEPLYEIRADIPISVHRHWRLVALVARNQMTSATLTPGNLHPSGRRTNSLPFTSSILEQTPLGVCSGVCAVRVAPRTASSEEPSTADRGLLPAGSSAGTEGAFVYMPPYLEHGMKALNEVVMLLTMIKNAPPPAVS
jgi:hypothetical protein